MLLQSDKVMLLVASSDNRKRWLFIDHMKYFLANTTKI